MKDKSVKTIELNGKTYAVGLFWQPVQDEKNYIKEVKNTIQTVVPDANLYCLKKGAANQYGLGSTSSGHKSGMLSGASGIANALRDKSSAVCVFKLKEGYWIITIRNNLILTDQDVIYTDENDAKEAFNTMQSIPDWGYKIAPAEWGIEDATEILASDLMQRGQAVELKKVETNFTKNIVILLLVALAGWKYKTMQDEKAELKRKILEAKRKEELKKLTPPPPPPPPPPAPWESLTDLEDMAKKCTILIVNSTATIPGWNLENATCIEKQLSSLWKRGSYGTAGWIFEAQQFGILPKELKLVANDSSYNTIIGSLEIPSIKHGQSKPNYKKAEIQKKLNSIFHALKISGLKLEDKKITVKNPKDATYSKDYPYTQFKFTDVAYRRPLDWVKTLKEIQGIQIDSIVWDNKKKTWSYTGKIYELTPEMIKEDEEKEKKRIEEENKKQTQEQQAQQPVPATTTAPATTPASASTQAPIQETIQAPNNTQTNNTGK